MDVTVTAQAVQQLAQMGSGMTPLQLAMTAGPLISHAIQPVMGKIPTIARPAVAMLGMIGASAVTAVSQGASWQTALGYGAVTALAGTGWHLTFLKSDGVMGMISGVLGGLQQAQSAKSDAPKQP